MKYRSSIKRKGRFTRAAKEKYRKSKKSREQNKLKTIRRENIGKQLEQIQGCHGRKERREFYKQGKEQGKVFKVGI